MFAVLKGAIKNIQAKDIAEIIIINYVEAKKKENLDIKSMTNNVNAAKNILKQGISILSGSGIESYVKQKRDEALPLGESVTPEAHPIASGVGGLFTAP